MFLGDKFDKFSDYDELLDKYLTSLKKERYILKKYKEVLKDEQWKKIFLFNIIKFYPNKKFVYLLKKLIKNLKKENK